MTKTNISNQKLILFVAFLILTFLALQEILFRLVFPLPEALNFNRVNYCQAHLTPEMQNLRYLSNRAFIWISEPDGVEFFNTLNLYGFRDKSWSISHKSGPRRVMFVGDSVVEGIMAGDNETIPKCFEKRAREKKDSIEVLNLGVTASQIPQYFILICDALPLLKPDDLILVFHANDLPPPPFNPAWLKKPFVPEYSNPWQPRVFRVLNSLLNEEVIPLRWHVNAFPFVSAVPNEANPWSSEKDAAYFKTFVDPKVASAMEQGRFNPHVVNDCNFYKPRLSTPFSITQHLLALKNYASQFSKGLFIVYIPTRSQISNAYLSFQSKYNINKSPDSLTLMAEQYQLHANILEKTCKQINIPFVDLTPKLLRLESKGKRLFWNYDEHMTAEGYNLVGQYLYDWWDENKKDRDAH